MHACMHACASKGMCDKETCVEGCSTHRHKHGQRCAMHAYAAGQLSKGCKLLHSP